MSRSSAHAKPRSKPAPGDKVFVGGSPEDRKVFIRDIINLIQSKGAKTLLVTVADLSECLHKQSALSPSNLFRKQYGNLEHVFSYEHLSPIFFIENSVIRLQPLSSLEQALADEYLPQDLFDQCATMHRTKRVHDLTTWRNIGKNECRRCRIAYSTLANTARACEGNVNHEPSFDFDKNEDVLQCGIVV